MFASSDAPDRSPAICLAQAYHRACQVHKLLASQAYLPLHKISSCTMSVGNPFKFQLLRCKRLNSMLFWHSKADLPVLQLMAVAVNLDQHLLVTPLQAPPETGACRTCLLLRTM